MTHDTPSLIESIDTRSLIDAIFYSLPDGIAVFGTKVQNVVYANKAFCEIFGYNCEMMLQSYRAISILPPLVVSEIREHYPFLDEQPVDDNPRYYSTTRKDKTPLEVRVTESLFSSNAQSHRLITVVDVTEKQRLEKSRENAERIIRHDLRDYVLSLGSAAEIMSQLQDDTTASAEMLHTIRTTVIQTMELMESGQQAFLMEEGLYELNHEQIDLHKLIDNAVNLLDPMIELYGVTINSDLPPADSPVTFLGERSLITRALSNLLRNALEAEEIGSVVTVSCTRGKHSVIIDVHNQSSVDPAVCDRFFEKYVSGRRHGAGLGTYIAKLIVELHGGAISMHTSARSGTTVTMTIPLE